MPWGYSHPPKACRICFGTLTKRAGKRSWQHIPPLSGGPRNGTVFRPLFSADGEANVVFFSSGHGTSKEAETDLFGERVFIEDDPVRALAFISATGGMSWWANHPLGMLQRRLQRVSHL